MGAAITITAILVIVVLVLLLALFDVGQARDDRCPARRSGWRCVHGEDHPGSHRDEHGRYWND